MMKILATFPGKAGDILWALPAIRTISEATDAPVDLMIAGAYKSLVPLLQMQPYLGEVTALESWEVRDTAPMTPRTPAYAAPADIFTEYNEVVHLGYKAWPELPLPMTTYSTLQQQWPDRLPSLPSLSLDRPWITPPTYAERLRDHGGAQAPDRLVLGFTDEHFELKVGLAELLWLRSYDSETGERTTPAFIYVHNSPRWNDERRVPGCSWETAAAWLSVSAVFLGDCSALHVLACAVGVPAVVLMEPNPHRHNDIFYPYGKYGSKVTLVLGTDGQPTFDARHVWEVIQAQRVRFGAVVAP